MVSVHYPSDDTLVPDEFNILIVSTANDETFEMAFDNRHDRDVGEAKSAQGVEFLIAQGCEKRGLVHRRVTKSLRRPGSKRTGRPFVAERTSALQRP